MRTPGFTAEESLHTAGLRFRMPRIHRADANEAVYPQLRRSQGFCEDECDGLYEWGTTYNAYCKARCAQEYGR
jgi:hypothetical protein